MPRLESSNSSLYQSARGSFSGNGDAISVNSSLYQSAPGSFSGNGDAISVNSSLNHSDRRSISGNGDATSANQAQAGQGVLPPATSANQAQAGQGVLPPDTSANQAQAGQGVLPPDKKKNRLKDMFNVIKGHGPAKGVIHEESRGGREVLNEYGGKSHRKSEVMNFFKGIPKSVAKGLVIGTAGAIPLAGPSLAAALTDKIDKSKFGQRGQFVAVDPKDIIPDPSKTNPDGSTRSVEEMEKVWKETNEHRSKIKETQAAVNDRTFNKVLGNAGFGLSQLAGAAAASTAVGGVLAGGLPATAAAIPLSANVLTQAPIQLALHGLENRNRYRQTVTVPQYDGNDNGNPTGKMENIATFVNKKTAAKLKHTQEALQENRIG